MRLLGATKPCGAASATGLCGEGSYSALAECDAGTTICPICIRRPPGLRQYDAFPKGWIGNRVLPASRVDTLPLVSSQMKEIFPRLAPSWNCRRFPLHRCTSSPTSTGLIYHADQGPIYVARKYRERMAAHGIKSGMRAKGNAYDNAVTEELLRQPEERCDTHLALFLGHDITPAIYGNHMG